MFVTHDKYFEKADELLDHYLNEKDAVEKHWAIVELSALHYSRHYVTNPDDNYVEYNNPIVQEAVARYPNA